MSRRYMFSRESFAEGGTLKVVLLLSSLLVAFPLLSQDQDKIGPVQLFPEVKHARTLPLREMKSVAPHTSSSDPDDDADAGPRRVIAPKHRVAAAATTSVVPSVVHAPVNVTAGLNFEGVAADGTRSTPDTSGSVGATQYVQWVNLSFSVFDKTTGNLLLGPVYGNTLWSALGSNAPCATSDDGDIEAEYDRIAGRWVMSQHAYGASGQAPFYMCVAVSTTSDATGTWNAYAFQLPSNFPDYPKLAVWPDAYYISVNEQNPLTFANLGGLACALDRTNMLAGNAADAVQCFEMPATYLSLLPSDLDGTILPPSGSPNYFLDLGTNSLNLWKFHVDWVTPANSTFTGPTAIPVATFSKSCNGSSQCIPQPGTTQLLDGIGDRLMFRLAYRHFADGHESLVASHTVNVPAGIRWYEIQSPGTTPQVFQQGTFNPDSNWRWMPSIAMDQMGDIALGYSAASSTLNPAIRYTGRSQSDALGTMETENSIMEGPSVQTTSNRWGDYSAMSIDPVDDCTFFYTNQYQNTAGSNNWHTRIASFKFPSCTSNPPVRLAPNGLFFSSENIGVTSPTQTVTLTNTQSVALNISSITPSGDFSETNTCGTSVAALGTCTITVSFTPTVQGTRNGQIVVSDDGSGSPQQVVNLTGTGGGPIATLAQSSLSFATLVKSASGKSVKLTNTGGSVLTLNSITASGDYSLSGSCAGSTFVNPNTSCTITVTFTPTVTGTVLGAVTITDNAPGSPHLIKLQGTGETTLSVSPVSLSFASTTVGSTSAAKAVTVANNTATTQTFSYAASGNFAVAPGGTSPCGASPASLNANVKCTLNVTFSPTSNGSIRGGVTITDKASGVAYNPQIVSITATGAGGATSPLSFQPSTQSYGNVIVGSTLGPKVATLKNTTATSVTLTTLTASGDFTLATTGQNVCLAGTVLKAGATCNLGATFAPSVQGSLDGSITIVDNATSGPTTQVYGLSGTGVWPIALSPTSLNFGTQGVGTTSAAKVVTVLNYTSSAVSLTNVAASGNYSIASGGTCGASVPAASGGTAGSCTFDVTFTPANTGTLAGAASVAHGASTSPQVVSLTGTGQ